MAGRVILLSNPIKLTAYSSSGLPVSYAVIEGTDKVAINPQGDFYFLEALALGYAKIMAFQDGNTSFLPAEPVYKAIKVIGIPVDPSDVNVTNEVLPTGDPSLVEASILNPPSKPLVGDLLITYPLEPDQVKVIKPVPNKPIHVFLFQRPIAVSNLIADLTTNLKPRDLKFMSAGIVSIPNRVDKVSAINKVIEDLEFVDAMTLTTIKNKSIVVSTAVVDTSSASSPIPWDDTSDDSRDFRSRFLTVQSDGYGLDYNPYWTFSSRLGESTPYNEFRYSNNRLTASSGKYSPRRLGERNRYTAHWMQTQKAGLSISEEEAYKMYFVGFNARVYYIFKGNISGTIAEKDQIASEEYAKFYDNNCDTNITNFNSWVYNIKKTYGGFVAQPSIDFSMTQGAFIIDRSLDKPRFNSFRGLNIFSGTKEEFDNLLSRTGGGSDTGFQECKSLANKTLGKFYEDKAGDVLYHCKVKDSQVKHHPTFPLPHLENFANSHINYKYNIYAIGGSDVELYFADYNTSVLAPDEVIGGIV